MKYDITLIGDASQSYNKVKSLLNDELIKKQYPLRLVEKNQAGTTKLTYQDEVIYFSDHSLKEGILQMKDLLPKINAKTGKICRCSNCKDCPSNKKFKDI